MASVYALNRTDYIASSWRSSYADGFSRVTSWILRDESNHYDKQALLEKFSQDCISLIKQVEGLEKLNRPLTKQECLEISSSLAALLCAQQVLRAD